MTRSEESQAADMFLENILKFENIKDIALPIKMDNYSVIKYIDDRLNFRPTFEHLNNICPNDSIFLVTGISAEYTNKVSSIINVLEQMSGLEFPFYAVKENRFIVYERGIRRCSTLLLPNNKQVGIYLFNTEEYKISKTLEEQPIKIS